MAEGASLVRISTSSMFAVSCEEAQMSCACCSGESSSPKAAWMPPCAFAELHDWIEPFVAIATRAPARSAETAAARPEAPLPITSTSKGPWPDIARILANSRHFRCLYVSRTDILRCRGWQRYGRCCRSRGCATEGGTQMRRFIVVVALALVVPAAASARPPGPVAPAPTPLPAAQAEALVAAPAAVPAGSETW